MSDEPRPLSPAAVELLGAIAARTEVARRLELGSSELVLRSIVESAANLFSAEASSIALYDPEKNVLRFVTAAGEQGAGVIGLEIGPDRGLVGYVFSTGQGLAIADVLSDKRFGKGFAQQTGYVPRSIVAVPLNDDRGTIGVLEVLDKRDSSSFTLRDVELAGIFARQAAVAIRASRVERDTMTLLREAIARLAADPDDAAGAADGDARADAVEELVAAAVAGVAGEDDPFWPLVERVAAVRRAAPDQIELVTGIIDVLVRQAGRDRSRRSSFRRRSRDD